VTLTAKQQTFCEEYLIDLNATQAAIRAGYSVNAASEIGYENLSKPQLSEYITRLRAERSAETKIDASWVLREAKEAWETCKDNGELNVGKGFLEIAGKHVDVKAFDTTVKTEGELIIKTVIYDGSIV
tara:strand:- start:958 stop:1341 length:384 start_codon:yes stop_codon:yes gene_type:complete